MHDPALVRSLESFGQLPRETDDLVEWKVSSGDPFGKRRPFDELQDERSDRTAVLAAVDRANARVIQRRKGGRFLFESGTVVWVVGDGIGQALERNVAPQFRIVRAIDLTHAAGSKKTLD